jgi:arabinose-5-phosphate isomerase
MTCSPKTIDEEKKALEAMAVMEQNGITVLPVVDEKKRVKGIIHLHGLLGGREFAFDEN